VHHHEAHHEDPDLRERPQDDMLEGGKSLFLALCPWPPSSVCVYSLHSVCAISLSNIVELLACCVCVERESVRICARYGVRACEIKFTVTT